MIGVAVQTLVSFPAEGKKKIILRHYAIGLYAGLWRLRINRKRSERGNLHFVFGARWVKTNKTREKETFLQFEHFYSSVSVHFQFILY